MAIRLSDESGPSLIDAFEVGRAGSLEPSRSRSRRGFLLATVGTLWAGVTGAAAAVLGRAAIVPSLIGREARWVRAGRVDQLETNVPMPVTIRIARRDGYLETLDQQVVFVTKSESGEVSALSSTCAHLGCNVTFDRDKQQFLCPCHEGVFALDGSVVSGPPPEGLKPLPAKVEDRRLLVQV